MIALVTEKKNNLEIKNKKKQKYMMLFTTTIKNVISSKLNLLFIWGKKSSWHKLISTSPDMVTVP